MRVGIAGRLLIIAGVAFLPPAAFNTYVTVASWNDAITAAGHQLMGDAIEVAGDHESALREIRSSLLMLADRPELGAALNGSNALCRTYLLAFYARLNDYDAVYANLALNEPESGELICSALGGSGPALENRDWLHAVASSGEFSPGGYLIGRVSGRPSLVAGTPVRDGGRVRAILTGTLDLAQITRVLSVKPEREDAAINIFRSDGLVIFRSPDPGIVGSRRAEAPMVQAVKSIALPATIEATGFDGVRRLNAIRRLPGPGDAFVSVSRPVASIHAQARELVLTEAVVLVLSLALAGVVAWLVGDRLIVTSIRALAVGTRRLMAGDYAARVALRSGDELQDLATTFNNLAATLDRRTQDLEQDRSRLTEVSAQLRAMIDAAPFAIVVADQGIVKLWSRGAERMFGFHADEIVGRPYADIVPVQKPALEMFRERVLRGEDVRGAEMFFQTKERRTIEARLSTRPITLADGASGGTLAVIEDLTDMRDAERRLRSTSLDLATVLETAPVAILAYDEEERVRLWNRAAERMFGWTPAEVLGRPAPFFATDDDPEYRHFVERIRAGERIMARNLRRRTKDGRLLDTMLCSSAIYDHAGNFHGWVSILMDITEENRTAAQLRQSQRMEAVGQLTGGLAHDLNNLLAIIIGSLELANEDLGSDHPVRPLLQNALDASLRGANLNRSLLAFSRRQDLRPQTLDLHEIISDTANLVRRMLGEQIGLKLDIAPDVWPIHADRALLETAIVNLLINARDAMPSGGNIELEAENAVLDELYVAENPETLPGDYVMICVSDNGTGMPPDVLARAFDPFFTTKEVGRGTGLGLSMVYGFIKQSEGHVKIYSEPGQGTTVRLYLPRERGNQASAAAPAEAAADTPRGSGELILVVEDNDALRRIALRELSALGYRVAEAANAAEALIAIDRGAEPDLLFTDVVMPGSLDGRGLAQAAQERRPNLRVLLTSGFTERSAAQHWATLPWPLLSKPYRKGKLATAIRDALAGPIVRAPEQEKETHAHSDHR